MSGAFDYFEILILAMLAVFLIYRLGSVLGKRTGHERRPTDLFPRSQEETGTGEDNVVSLPDRDDARADAERRDIADGSDVEERPTAEFVDQGQSRKGENQIRDSQ